MAWLVVYLAPDYTTILCVGCASLGLVCGASFRSGYVWSRFLYFNILLGGRGAVLHRTCYNLEGALP